MRATQLLASAILALSVCHLSTFAQESASSVHSASSTSSSRDQVRPANFEITLTTTTSATAAVQPAAAQRFMPMPLSMPLSMPMPIAMAGEGNHVLGALMLCGGGQLPNTLMETFFELGHASQGALVIIPSASSSADAGDYEPMLNAWQKFPWASIKVLHAMDRKQVENDSDFIKPLQQATAVWISGGDQRRLAERYLGTSVEHELKKVVVRGGIIGGTSAGSAIASRVMISGGRQQPVISNGLDLLPGSIIDQHFSQRKRYDRLASAVEQHPDRVGIGIDEGTGLVVSKQQARVLGDGSVYVYSKTKKSKAGFEPLKFESGSAFSLPEYHTK
ncbi:MAG: cyanophycinase [Pirellulaceae bacterium]|nr:cyanophycinase [Pirellulaceae bacterium]